MNVIKEIPRANGRSAYTSAEITKESVIKLTEPKKTVHVNHMNKIGKLQKNTLKKQTQTQICCKIYHHQPAFADGEFSFSAVSPFGLRKYIYYSILAT